MRNFATALKHEGKEQRARGAGMSLSDEHADKPAEQSANAGTNPLLADAQRRQQGGIVGNTFGATTSGLGRNQGPGFFTVNSDKSRMER